MSTPQWGLSLSLALLTVSTVDGEVYHRDASHLWNRLHRALVVRTSRDGAEFGYDATDPLLVNNSKHLLSGESHTKLLQVLYEFNDSEGSEKLGGPLRRAVLQHDLWSVFDWVAARREGSRWVGYDASPERKALLRSLSQAISKLALPADEILELKGNYENATASGEYPPGYDARSPATPFLPRDLLLPNSSWVELDTANHGGAPVHTIDFGGRSSFRVFVRLPTGRESTKTFLDQLRGVDRRVLTDVAFIPFDELEEPLPRFPLNTQFALVRQMMVIDDSKRIQETQITQSIQLRVHVGRTAFNSEDAEHEAKLKRAGQDFFEFALRRAELFAGKHGGLHPADDKSRTILSPLRRHGSEPDPISGKSGAEILKRAPHTLMQCVHCHRDPNVYSFESFVQQMQRPPWISTAKQWKQSQFSWGLYCGLVGDN